MTTNEKYAFDKVLRIGVSSKEKAMMKEHLLLPQNVFSIGMNGEVQQHIDGLPHHTLFYTKEGSYFLNFTPSMGGFVTNPQNSLEKVRVQDGVACTGDIYSLRLSENENKKGKIIVGDFTFIFQFIDAPPIAQQARYVKQEEKFIEDDDLLFLSLTVFNSLCAIMLMVYANYYYVIPEPPELTAEQIAQILDIEVEPEEKIEEPVEEPIEDPNANAEKSSESKEPSNEPAEQPEKVIKNDSKEKNDAKMSNDEIDAALSELENLSVVAILGAEGSGAPVLSSASIFNEDSAEISISNTDVTSGGGLKIASVGDKALNADANINIKTASGGGGKVNVGGPKVKGPKIAIKDGAMKSSSNKCDAEIKKIVKKNQGNINFCYDRVVQDNPSLAGKIKLGITIQSGGKNKVNFVQDEIQNATFTDCIKRKVKKWKFDSKCDNITFQKSYVLKLN